MAPRVHDLGFRVGVGGGVGGFRVSGVGWFSGISLVSFGGLHTFGLVMGLWSWVYLSV